MDQPLVQPVEQLPGQPVVTRATVADRSRVVETVAAAFAADPAFRWYFPDDRTYHRQAVAFAGHLFDRRVGAGTVWIVAGGAAVAMWQPPGMAEVAAELSLPAEVTGRLTAWDAAVHAALPQQPHWYLGVLATHPAYAGRRWGRAVLAAGLRAATDAGLPSYLETANPRNVELYGRAGWRVTEELTVAGLPARVAPRPADQVSRAADQVRRDRPSRPGAGQEVRVGRRQGVGQPETADPVVRGQVVTVDGDPADGQLQIRQACRPPGPSGQWYQAGDVGGAGGEQEAESGLDAPLRPGGDLDQLRRGAPTELLADAAGQPFEGPLGGRRARSAGALRWGAENDDPTAGSHAAGVGVEEVVPYAAADQLGPEPRRPVEGSHRATPVAAVPAGGAA